MYKIGDTVVAKYARNKDWGERLIVGFDKDEQGNAGYLWVYPDIDREEAQVYTSLNHTDPEFNTYWKLKEV